MFEMEPLYWRYLFFAQVLNYLTVADCYAGYPLINKVWLFRFFSGSFQSVYTKIVHDPQVDQTLDPEKSNVPYFYGQSTIVGMETADNGLYTCSGSNQSSSEKDIKNASRAYDPGGGSAGYRRSGSGNNETKASLNEPPTVNQTNFNSTAEDKSADVYCVYLTVIVLFVLRSCVVPIVGLALAWQSSCRSSHRNEEISKSPMELNEMAETNGIVIKREKGQSYFVLLNNSSNEKTGQDYYSHLWKEFDLTDESTHHTVVVLGNSTVGDNNKTTTLLSSGLALGK